MGAAAGSWSAKLHHESLSVVGLNHVSGYHATATATRQLYSYSLDMQSPYFEHRLSHCWVYTLNALDFTICQIHTILHFSQELL